MTMANSRISKKSAKTIDAIEAYGLRRVTEWTRSHLLEIQKSSKLPICMALQNGDYLVATYKVEKISDVCWRVNHLEFTDKRSAIFYCSMMHLGKVAEAQALFKIDKYVGQLDLDKSLFRVRLDSAHTANDQFKIDLYSCRYEESKGKLRLARQELEILIANAKYYNSRLLTGK